MTCPLDLYELPHKPTCASFGDEFDKLRYDVWHTRQALHSYNELVVCDIPIHKKFQHDVLVAENARTTFLQLQLHESDMSGIPSEDGQEVLVMHPPDEDQGRRTQDSQEEGHHREEGPDAPEILRMILTDVSQ